MKSAPTDASIVYKTNGGYFKVDNKNVQPVENNVWLTWIVAAIHVLCWVVSLVLAATTVNQIYEVTKEYDDILSFPDKNGKPVKDERYDEKGVAIAWMSTIFSIVVLIFVHAWKYDSSKAFDFVANCASVVLFYTAGCLSAYTLKEALDFADMIHEVAKHQDLPDEEPAKMLKALAIAGFTLTGISGFMLTFFNIFHLKYYHQ